VAERFSWWFTSLTHRFADDGAFGHRMQQAELACLAGSAAASTALAENYVGLPLQQPAHPPRKGLSPARRPAPR
jgi:p-hydroxybenzoate 3-monooxygenase